MDSRLRRKKIPRASAAGLAMGLALFAVSAAHATTFSYTGGEQTYVVPDGAARVWVTATGAPGGGPYIGTLPPGRGATVSGSFAVTPGQTLYVYVGGTSQLGTGGFTAGFNGGGAGGTLMGLTAPGGGGASDVRTSPAAATDSLTTRLIVAAGGGGSASPAARGGNAGQPGGSIGDPSVAGGAGTETAGGAGGACGPAAQGCGQPGTLGVGGDGGASGSGAQGAWGTGGGGGLYGGGGGGSSLVPTGGSFALAELTTAPSVEITTQPQPSPEGPPATTPPAGASCLGTLSSAAGEAQIRDDFAPLMRNAVAAIARQTGVLPDCFAAAF